MIGADDALALPAGVVTTPDGLHDVVRGTAIPVNAAGRIVLAHATPRAAADSVARAYGLARDRALADVLAFCRELNARLLLNATPRFGVAASFARACAALPALLPHGALPSLPTVRRGVDTQSPRRLVLSAVRALAPAAALHAGAAFVAAAVVVAPAGGIGVAAAGAAAVAFGLVAHELGHLAALVAVPACVVTRGARVTVVHRAVEGRRAAVVTAAGPCVGIAFAAVAVAATRVAPSAEAATAAGVLALQLLGLTVATADGRRLCGLR